VGGCEVFGEKVVMMAAGKSHHTACVTKDGAIWSWGCGGQGDWGTVIERGDSGQKDLARRCLVDLLPLWFHVAFTPRLS